MKTADDDYVLGCEANDFWVAQQNGPVYLKSDFRLLARELSKKSPRMRLLRAAASPNEPLPLSISGLLSLIERNYDLESVEADRVKEYDVLTRSNLRRPNYSEVVGLCQSWRLGLCFESNRSL